MFVFNKLFLVMFLLAFSCNEFRTITEDELKIHVGSYWVYEIKDYYPSGDSTSYIDTIKLVDSFLHDGKKYYLTSNQNYIHQSTFLSFYDKLNGRNESYYIFPTKDTIYTRLLYLYGNDTDTLSYNLEIKYDYESINLKVKAGSFNCKLFSSEETKSNENENNFYQKRIDYVDPKFGLIKTENYDGDWLMYSQELVEVVL